MSGGATPEILLGWVQLGFNQLTGSLRPRSQRVAPASPPIARTSIWIVGSRRGKLRNSAQSCSSLHTAKLTW